MKKLIIKYPWEIGRKNKRISLNDIRLVEEEDEVYYEIRILHNKKLFYVKLDERDKNLVDRYRWGLTSSRGYISVITSYRKNGKKISERLIVLLLELKHRTQINHLDGNSLNMRRSNLYVKNGTSFCKKLVPDIDENFIRNSLKSKHVGVWQRGKLKGSVYFRDTDKFQRWMVEFSNPLLAKSFSAIKYGYEEAKIMAENFREEECMRRGNLKNSYRIHTSLDNSQFLEVKAICRGKEMVFYCDIEDIKLVSDNCWCILLAIDKRYRVYTKQSKYFHQKLGLYKVTDHIDGNPLNNRRCNLRDGSLINARNHKIQSNNTSGYTGVNFNKSSNCWTANWTEENSKKRYKSFKIISNQRSYEEAKQLAVEYRQNIDLKLNLNQQQRLSSNSLIINSTIYETITGEVDNLAKICENLLQTSKKVKLIFKCQSKI
jgi:hypothetical protein